MPDISLILVPRDGLFFNSGRGWFTTGVGRTRSLEWPYPSTICGALRTAWGRRREAEYRRPMTAEEWRDKTRAVSLVRYCPLRRSLGDTTWQRSHRLWPAPADALGLPSLPEVVRLEPAPGNIPTMGRDDDPAREALWWPSAPVREKPQTLPAWWSEQDFTAWLCGLPVRLPHRDAAAAERMPRRAEIHLAIDSERLTAADGQLFVTEVAETLQAERRDDGRGMRQWAIGVHGVAAGSAEIEPVFTLGGNGKLAFADAADARLFDCPDAVAGAFEPGIRGLRAVAVTPAVFDRGWLPDNFVVSGKSYLGRLPGISATLVLRAAFVPRADHVSGWDLAWRSPSGRLGGPKRTDRLVPRGAVYFFEKQDGSMFTAMDARALWDNALGGRTEEGFGRFAPGTWNPANSRRD